MSDVGKADILYWVGCAGSYNPRNQRVSQAMIRIFRAAGVDFAILGTEESCNAEWARRAGEEYLYQMQAEANVKILKQYSFKRIVTQCPPDLTATACPFCLIMLEEALGSREGQASLELLDIAEGIAEALKGDAGQGQTVDSGAT